jgi:integrase
VHLDPGTTTSDEGRVTRLTADLRTLLASQRTITDAYQKERETICPWVFHRHGQQIQDHRTAWQSACRLVGCPGRIPQNLRRTAVRNFVRAGVSEHVAMKLSGHKTASVFRRYDIVSDSDLADAARKLDMATQPAQPGVSGIPAAAAGSR